jgi:NAD(P) transhydrogenase subunit alpha
MGVTIVGKTNLPSELPTQASQLYGNNVLKLLNHLKGESIVEFNLDDEITRAITVTSKGKVTWEPPKSPAPKKPSHPENVLDQKTEPSIGTELGKPAWQKIFHPYVAYIVAGLLCVMLGFVGTEEFLGHLFVFMLSCFVGYMVVWNVTPSLQTPLMSLTNAISGIIVLGGMIHISGDHPLLAGAAILIAAVNIAGGFLVTQRMLGMFKK